jgi:hypothetical protein
MVELEVDAPESLLRKLRKFVVTTSGGSKGSVRQKPARKTAGEK